LNTFWAYEWMNFHGVKSMKHVQSALSDKVALNHLHELAVARKPCPQNLQVELVAGRGVDLSGHLDCNASACRKRQVDNLLRRAWHYFDRILVADGLSHEVSHHWNAKSAKLKPWLSGHLEVLLYLRSMGAENLIVFSEKPTPCQAHLAKHADEAGLPRNLDSNQKMLEDLATTAKISSQQNKMKEIEYAFSHPEFEHTVWGTIKKPRAGFSDKTVKRAIARDVVKRYAAHLVSDVATAHHAGAPLGAAVWLHGQLLRESARETTPAEIIFNLSLPVIEKVPIDVLLKIRKGDGDAFERFRDSLRKAVTARMREGPNPTRVADEIRQDLIEPELVRVRQRLASAEEILQKKAVVGLGLGSLMTTCGLLAGAPPSLAVTGGVAALTSVVGSAGQKYIDDRREVELSDMYFLWKAGAHKNHRG